MGFGKIPVLTFVTVLLASTRVAEGCSCLFGLTLCDHFLDADVVVRAKAVVRTEGESSNEDVVYQVEIIEAFKWGEDDTSYTDGTMDISLTTGGNSALCGIFMEIGEEYLIDLSRNTDTDGQLTAVGSCGLFRSWDSTTAEEIELLGSGCDDYDPCEGACGEFQECTMSFDFYVGASFYCADTCDPSPCAEDEVCELLSSICSGELASCPPVAYCSVDPCNSECGVFQECIQYTGNGNFYCSAVCKEGACNEGETCKTCERGWCRFSGSDGCPKKHICTSDGE